MVVNHLGLPLYKYYSPKIVVYEFSQLVKSVGQEAVFSERKYQADRELWIASLFTLGVSAPSDQQYWVGYGKDNTPDAEIVCLSESGTLSGKGRDLVITPIEIMEYELHSLSFEVELIKKLNKKYPPYFQLLIFVTKEGAYSHDELAVLVEKYNPNLVAVWLMGGTMNRMNLWELYPSPQWIKYNPVAVANNLKTSDIISLKRGVGYEDTQKDDVPRKEWDVQ